MKLSELKARAKSLFKSEQVEAPELGEGEYLYIRELSAGEKISLFKDVNSDVDNVFKVLACSLCDKEDLFNNVVDVETVKIMPQELINRLFDRVLKINNLTVDTQAEVKN